MNTLKLPRLTTAVLAAGVFCGVALAQSTSDAPPKKADETRQADQKKVDDKDTTIRKIDPRDLPPEFWENLPPELRGVATPPEGDEAAPPSRRRRDASTGAPAVSITPGSLYDFGIVAPDEEVTGSVMMINTGQTPLRVLKAQASCRCTAVQDIVGKTIEPGQSAPLTAVIEGRATPGPRSSTVRVLFEGYQQPVEVTFKLEVALPVRPRPGYIRAQREMTGTVRLEALEGESFSLLSANGDPIVYADGFDPDFDEPRSSYVVSYDFRKYGGQLPRYWVIETDHPRAPVIDLMVRHMSTQPARSGRTWRVNERTLIGNVKAGTTKEFEFEIEQFPRTSKLHQILTEDGPLKFEVLEQQQLGPKVTVRMKATVPADLKGLIYSRLRLIASDGEAVMYVFGRAVD